MQGRPRKKGVTRAKIAGNPATQRDLLALNAHNGLYFSPNSGGDCEAAIVGGEETKDGKVVAVHPPGRFNACFAEIDDLPIEEQHRLLDSCPLPPSIRVETRKSVHAYWPLAGDNPGDQAQAEWRDVQRRLIAYFKSDRAIKDPSRVMRLPGFDHVSADGSRKPVRCVAFDPSRRFTLAELLAAFPAVADESRAFAKPTAGQFAAWDALRAELGRRVIAHESATKNGNGRWDCRAICHDGKGDSGLFFDPFNNQTICNKGCEQAEILRAFGLPEKPEKPEKAKKTRGAAALPALTVTPAQAPPFASAAAAVATAAASLPDPPETEEAQDWRAGLLLNGANNPKRSYANTLLFVRQYPKWAGRWSRNEMANEPFLDGARLASGVVGDLISHCERELGFSPSTEYVERAINQAADDRPFHPVREYLRSLKWDKKIRHKTAAFDFWGTKETLHAIYFRKWMISAVARAMRPGCKVDTALVLVGAQGLGKSSFWDVLGSPWFSDTEMDGGKDGLMQLHGAWIYEWGEIDRVTSIRAAEEVKGFLASREDNFRAPYARTTQTHPRSSVIVGSTNKTRFLNDSSGSRRFWIVPITKKIPIDKLREVKDQLWAEAVAAFDAGKQWWLTEAEDASRDAAADEHQVEDSWTERAAGWVSGQGGFTLADLLEKLGVEHGRQGKADQMRASAILERLGYERKKVRDKKQTYYRWSKKEG